MWKREEVEPGKILRLLYIDTLCFNQKKLADGVFQNSPLFLRLISFAVVDFGTAELLGHSSCLSTSFDRTDSLTHVSL
jgi:hypothetical protein